jgi:hypothetical protein
MNSPDAVIHVSEVLSLLDDDRYFDKLGAVEFTSLSKRTIEKHLPEIPHCKIASKILIRKKDLVAWIERHAQKPKAERAGLAGLLAEAKRKAQHRVGKDNE